jgi:hypothetical protein
MGGDSNSKIAWHRVQLKRNRDVLKALETTRFTIGEVANSKMTGQTRETAADLKRKIAESERCIAEMRGKPGGPSRQTFEVCLALQVGAVGTLAQMTAGSRRAECRLSNHGKCF